VIQHFKKESKNHVFKTWVLPECLPLKADVFAVSIEQCRFLMIMYLKTLLDLNDINYVCLAPYSSKYYHP
jgi:hypothetical protein